MEFLERMTVCDVQALRDGHSSLTLITNEKGGIKDDSILTKINNKEYFMVLNAGCKDKDIAHMRSHLPSIGVELEVIEDRQLIAVQGPQAKNVIAEVFKGLNVKDIEFMQRVESDGVGLVRCGYTGEDGFELSIKDNKVMDIVKRLEAIKDRNSGLKVCDWVGLGARDTLRLEAGLCLYGHELNEEITPVEAMLTWTISKRRKEKGGFLGSDVVLKQLADGNVAYKRQGFIKDGIPVREGVKIFSKAGEEVGWVSSGAPAPSLEGKKSIGMAYIKPPHNKLNTQLLAEYRGKKHDIVIQKMPFVPANFYRKEI